MHSMPQRALMDSGAQPGSPAAAALSAGTASIEDNPPRHHRPRRRQFRGHSVRGPAGSRAVRLRRAPRRRRREENYREKHRENRSYNRGAGRRASNAPPRGRNAGCAETMRPAAERSRRPAEALQPPRKDRATARKQCAAPRKDCEPPQKHCSRRGSIAPPRGSIAAAAEASRTAAEGLRCPAQAIPPPRRPRRERMQAVEQYPCKGPGERFSGPPGVPASRRG